MLKLERVSHDNQISVTVRDRQQLFTRSFLIALSSALAIHLAVVILFHISPIKIRWNYPPPFPIIVEADLTFSKDSTILANANIDPKLQTSYIEPKPSLPALPTFPAFLAVHDIEYINEKKRFINPFLEIEKEIYQPSMVIPIPKIPRKTITLQISGPLAKRTVVNNNLNDRSLPSIPASLQLDKQLSTSYSVNVEEDTGRIFWYEQTQKTGCPVLDSFALSILRDLQFLIKPTNFVTSGEIEIHFNFDTTSDNND